MPISLPLITVNIEGAAQTVQNSEHKVLIVGQKSGGSAISGELQHQIGNDNSESTLFGARSMVTNMIRAFKRVNKVTRIDAIGLTDHGSGVAATGTIAVAGTADNDGAYTISIASEAQYTVTVAVTDGQSASTVGANMATAINALVNCPATASNSSGTLTITAANAGTIGNSISLVVKESTPIASMSCAVTSDMSGGGTDPTTTSVLDVIGEERYQTIIWDACLVTNTVKNFLDARFNVANNVLDGVAIISALDTFANLQTLGNLHNSRSLVIVGNKLDSATTARTGGALVEWLPMMSAYVGAVRSLRLTAGANITSILTGTIARDGRGGPALASRPYFNTPFPDIAVAEINHGFDATEIADLNTAGITIIDNNRTRTAVILGDVVTTYKTDSASNPDVSFKYLNYVDTASASREFFWNNLRAQYVQSRLTTGDLVEGRPMANEASIRSFGDTLYSALSKADYALTVAGPVALKAFKDNTTITIDPSCGLVTIVYGRVPIVVQLREIDATFKIAFSA